MKVADKSMKITSEPVQKKLKKKSIFSPENSSESDNASPPKINAIKTANNTVKCTKAPPKVKTADPKIKPTVPSRPGKLSH